jgi:hypothetical protein
MKRRTGEIGFPEDQAKVISQIYYDPVAGATSVIHSCRPAARYRYNRLEVMTLKTIVMKKFNRAREKKHRHQTEEGEI